MNPFSMNNTPKKAPILALLLAGGALAATAADRTLRFDTSAQVSGNLRQGPVQYTSSGAPLKASVNQVRITAAKAVVSAPAGSTLAAAQGKRSATFSGAVTVTRGGLNARGAQLMYSEATGQGVLTGSPSAVFSPAASKDAKAAALNSDPVSISAQQMSLDIDNNLSTSSGNVALKSGSQSASAQRLVFDETRELAILSGQLSLSRAASANAKELSITGNEARVLTRSKQMYVTGKVKLVQGSSTTTGDALYYDDQKNVAYVIGNAVSYDSRSHNTLKAPARGALEQRTDLGRVRALNAAYKVPTELFQTSPSQP